MENAVVPFVEPKSDTECVVAAVLAHAMIGSSGASVKFALAKYAEILEEMRKVGGYQNPSKAERF